MLLSQPLALSIIFLAGIAIAAPIIDPSNFVDLATRAPKVKLPLLGDTVKAMTLANRISSGLRPKPGTTHFWSGQDPGPKGPVSAIKTAEKAAAMKGGKTLEGELDALGVKIDPKSPHAQALGVHASKTLAQKASGHVEAHLGESLRNGNVYIGKERPEIINGMMNGRVSHLSEHQGGETKTTWGTKRL